VPVAAQQERGEAHRVGTPVEEVGEFGFPVQR
jgi:hypothetical protein